MDTSFYTSLGKAQMKAGLGELTKNAALFGGVHHELIKKTVGVSGYKLSGEQLVEATFTGIGAKDMLLRLDPREKHIALLFEYGHTIGHALELTEGTVTSHGEGVAIGMLGASYIAHKASRSSSARAAARGGPRVGRPQPARELLLGCVGMGCAPPPVCAPPLLTRVRLPDPAPRVPRCFPALFPTPPRFL